MSQRARVLWVIALAVLPLVCLAGFTVWLQLQDDEEHIARERVDLARAAALATQLFIEGHVATARSLSLHPSFTRPVSREFTKFLEGLVEQNPEWEGLGIIGPAGETRMASRGPAVNVADRPYFREAVTSGKPVVSAALIGRRSGLPTVVIAVPIDYPDGRGILAVPLPSPRLSQHLVKRIASPAVQITVIDAEGKAFIDPDAGRVAALASLRDRPEGAAVLSGETGSLVAAKDGVTTLFAFTPVNPYGWGMILSQPAASAFADARRNALERAALLAAILLVVAALAWYLGGRLAELYDRSQRSREEAEAARDALQRSIQTRDEFLAAASHDLRNPLAAIKGATDVLAMHLSRTGSVPPERLSSCVGHIARAARRMTKLIDGFLDVTGLQMGRRLEFQISRVDMVALARAIVEEAREAGSTHGINLQADAAVGADCDAARVERVIANLLDNAIKYSPEGGEIDVRVWADGSHACLSVTDRGLGVLPEERESIFNRFHRGSNVVGRIAGTGVGLAGARQIVEQHGGTLQVEGRPGGGSTFTVRLPGAQVARPAGRAAA